MMSIIVQMISIITIITITGEAVDLQSDKDFTEISEGCPFMENTEYDVTVKGSVSSLIGGCAYISYNASDKIPQSYSLWFGNIEHDGPYCRGYGIEYFLFYCLSKPLSTSADISKGRMYINKVWPYDEAANKTGARDRRCALYEKINNHDKTLRVAINSDVSCDGLSEILYNSQLIHRPNKGSMLMIFNKTKHDVTTATTESIQSISKRYERLGYILQNVGNRPNPFWKTEEIKEEKHRSVAYAKNEDYFEEMVDILMKIDQISEKYPRFKNHCASLLNRKKEWYIAYRSTLRTRGHNTNNIVESTICLFKDIVLERCKTFNAAAMVDFSKNLSNTAEKFHQMFPL